MAKKRSNEHIRAQKEGKKLDEYTCFFCLRQFYGNHGHHIILYSENGTASVQNMITLCPDCHRGYHNGTIKLDITRF